MHTLRQVHLLDGDVALGDLGHEGADGVNSRDIDRKGNGSGQDVGAGDDEDVVELGISEVGLDHGVGGRDKEKDEEEEEEESEGGRVEEAVETVECHEWGASGEVLAVWGWGGEEGGAGRRGWWWMQPLKLLVF